MSACVYEPIYEKVGRNRRLTLVYAERPLLKFKPDWKGDVLHWHNGILFSKAMELCSISLDQVRSSVIGFPSFVFQN